VEVESPIGDCRIAEAVIARFIACIGAIIRVILDCFADMEQGIVLSLRPLNTIFARGCEAPMMGSCWKVVLADFVCMTMAWAT
jgi:hypothetical protein